MALLQAVAAEPADVSQLMMLCSDHGRSISSSHDRLIAWVVVITVGDFWQAIYGLKGTDVTPGQTLMLPCGRILANYAAFNAGASVSKMASPSSSSG